MQPQSLAQNQSTLYERDFYAWCQQQSNLLKSRQWQLLDTKNLIEEIESLGKQQKQELRNRLGLLIGHLLKWQYQPQKQGNSWKATIREQRRQIRLLLEDNPSLQPYLQEALDQAYSSGIDLAIQETNLDEDTFPETCPYALEQIFDAQFLPEVL
ncbi:hypothetical protein BST81_16220 [Leptolyngbya sp. 'hensonii']|uniref:DUF29 domain-containing protein n=1 Tax=Leptolyngbya sp. 'hensonii' TaxID=1922337 RepID=UPI00094FD955|nr:DUF29 domain-containing protein [Leptolyngbya sp. 'hensonii']OLP17347.1 hypothetical protein BST81_16220 [Leptolyngbya sp. 'hensonii']